MDPVKRKRPDDGERDGKTKRINENEDSRGLTVKDDEVDEFFEILKRIQVAIKYFEKSHGGRPELTEKGWRPSFEADDFDRDNNNNKTENNGSKTEEPAEEISGLDRNGDPASTTLTLN